MTTLPHSHDEALEEITTRGPGRPRRFDADTEEQMILDAGMHVMQKNGFADASVADILAEAEVSSRAFYRHCPSKDELLLALFRRDAQRVFDQFEAVANAAASATEAIYSLIDCYLDLFYDPRRAARAAIMNSEAARRAQGYDRELEASQARLSLPLARALREGNDSGELASPDPEFDAFTILTLCSSASGATRRSKHASDRAEARSLVLRFIVPAIGLRPQT